MYCKVLAQIDKLITSVAALSPGTGDHRDCGLTIFQRATIFFFGGGADVPCSPLP